MIFFDEYVKREVDYQIGMEIPTQFLKDYFDYVLAVHTHSKVFHHHIFFVSRYKQISILHLE